MILSEVQRETPFLLDKMWLLFSFRYNECKEKLLPYLKKCGFNPKTDIYFLPCSGLTGSFLRSAPEEDLCPWYRWDLAVLWTVVWKSETARLSCQTVNSVSIIIIMKTCMHPRLGLKMCWGRRKQITMVDRETDLYTPKYTEINLTIPKTSQGGRSAASDEHQAMCS